MPRRRKARKPERTWLKPLGAIATALVLAVATAIGTGLGERLLDLFKSKSQPALVSSSATEELNECGSPLFVQRPAADRILSTPKAGGVDWTTFSRRNRASAAGQNVVEVSIQGESSRTITLTGIDFAVDQRTRPPGAVFSNPCGDSVIGRSLKVDVDRRPATIVASSSDPQGNVDGGEAEARSVYQPIRFPWTVSVTDPLLLNIIATAKRCYCTWRAYITWRSGGKSGRIAIDNHGRGYTVVGDQGVTSYSSSTGTWTPLPVS
jgi:hypothetical protein